MELKLHYNSPAPDNAEGWEHYSLPIGNSHFGGSIFGGIACEHIQVTENSLQNPRKFGGLNSFADIMLHFPHPAEDITAYERGLDIGKALAYVRYDWGKNHIEREYFASYPARAIVGKITSSEKMSFDVQLQIPYLTETEGGEKRGTVIADQDMLIMAGTMCAYNVHFEGQLKIVTDGKLVPEGNIATDGDVASEGGTLHIEDATETTFTFCGETNYELRPEIFTEEDDHKKLRDFDPHDKVCEIMKRNAAYSYAELKAEHLKDYTSLFGRVSLELGETDVPEKTTDVLLADYKEEKSHYLEVLYFQYGRYLLISSSRAGCLPANLQGVWNYHEKPPWGSGYWHNINIQMNYWPAFITNIGETFDAYMEYNLAVRNAAQERASAYIKEVMPENYSDTPGACGWALGTVNYPYFVGKLGGHSGPGTGALTSKLFWEQYAFTGDKKILQDVVYPALFGMAKFLMRSVKNYDGKYLSAFSASPEQEILEGIPEMYVHYHTVGCAFDQQMIYENAKDLLRCVEILGEENLPEEDIALINEVRKQIDHYDPVQIGWNGQVKEYREEGFYAEIGSFTHRHISQLVGLYPGSCIGSETPAWRDAAKKTLNYRSDRSTGWGLAHRLNAWARCCDGNRTYKLYMRLLETCTYPNLWDLHPPFQIDGNLGGTSGVAEMLLQSHEKYIEPLPCIPDVWSEGAFTGLVARGGFVFDVKWRNGCATEMTVHSKNGGVCRIKYLGIGCAKMDFEVRVIDKDHIEFDTEAGLTYKIAEIPEHEKLPVPESLTATRELCLTWNFPEPVNIWRAIDSSPTYDLIGINIGGNEYRDLGFDFGKAETVTYKITRADTLDAASAGAYVTLNHSTELDRQRYRLKRKQYDTMGGCRPRKVHLPEYMGE